LINDWLELLRTRRDAHRDADSIRPIRSPVSSTRIDQREALSAEFRGSLFKPHILRRTIRNSAVVGGCDGSFRGRVAQIPCLSTQHFFIAGYFFSKHPMAEL